MKNRLAGRGANVDADVVAIRAVPLLDRSSGNIDRVGQLDSFLRACGEPVGHVPARDEQSVAVAHRERVPQAEDVIALVKQTFGGYVAERAVRMAHRVPLAARFVTTSLPSSPASRHSTQRHCPTGRRASRMVWQTRAAVLVEKRTDRHRCSGPRSCAVTRVHARLEAGAMQPVDGHVRQLVAEHHLETTGSVVAKIGAERDASGRGTAASQGTA